MQDILHSAPYLQTWFDRDISFDAGEGLSADTVSLPRLDTSHSNEKLRSDRRIMKKIDVKLSVVESAIYSIGRDAKPTKSDGNSKLNYFLKLNNLSSDEGY